MAEVDYSKLTDREIDALVAERVMEWHVDQYAEIGLGHEAWWVDSKAIPQQPPRWKPSADDNAVRLVRNRIAKLGREVEFDHELRMIILRKQFNPIRSDEQREFDMMQAIPRQQCEAILTVLDGRQK